MPKIDPAMAAMVDMFVFETTELLEKLDEILLRTESEQLTAEDIGEIFRIMHTVKGSAAMMGLGGMSKLAHSLEDLFSLIREQPDISYDKPALYELLYAGLDGLKSETENVGDEDIPAEGFEELIAANHAFAQQMKGEPAAHMQAAAKNEKPPALDIAEGETAFVVRYEDSCLMPDIRAMTLLNQLRAVAEVKATLPPDLEAENAAESIAAEGLIVKLVTDNEAAVEERLRSGINVLSVEKLQPPQPDTPKPAESQPAESQPTPAAPSEKPAKTQRKNEEQSAIIAVKLEKLDRLMKLAAEIVIAQSAVINCSELAPYRGQLGGFYKSGRTLKKLTDELQDLIMSARMVPISTAFSKMSRIVRDMNKKLGKNVTLVTVGEQTEVDKSVADMLGDPLMHLVRNAVDHGIEPPEERAAAGKSEPAAVTLSACYESNDILITVSDNGAGMDAKALLEKGREKGILKKPEHEYSERECYELIMEAGFSTNTEVTEYSGRGVGMDVVKKNLEQVGGTLRVDSRLGEGSTFTIRVPMSLSVCDCITVRLGERRFAVPAASISEVFRAEEENIIVTPEGFEAVQRGGLYRVVRLSERFGIEGCQPQLCRGIMLLCHSTDGSAAIFADSVSEDMQIVIKPFSAYLAGFGLKQAGFAGTSILGDGSIIPVLDTGEIIRGSDRK